MAAINGVDDQTAQDFFDPDQDSNNNNKVTELTKRVESLELEKKEMKDTIKKLSIEIEGSEEDKRILESIAARADELEIEVSRLQHDLVTSMSEGDELGAEVAELKRVLGEKEGKLEGLEREVDGLKKEKVESEKKVRELERNVGLLEVREMEEKSKRVRVEEEMREKLDEKDREVSGFKKKIDDLESELDKCRSEKNSAEQTTKEMEERILLWQKEIVETEKVIAGLKDKTLDGVNGTARDVKLGGDDEEEGNRLKWQLPLVAFSAAAVVCVCYARWR